MVKITKERDESGLNKRKPRNQRKVISHDLGLVLFHKNKNYKYINKLANYKKKKKKGKYGGIAKWDQERGMGPTY